MKTLVIYALHKIDRSVNFFIKRGIYRDDPETFYIFVVNNDSEEKIFLKGSNVKVFYRENEGRDFGAWDYALKNFDIQGYDYFIFLNSSVLGPFLPKYFNRRWTEIFINFIQDDTILVGSMSNYEISYHIQSFILCTNRKGLSEIRDLIKSYSSRKKTILSGEVEISKRLIEEKYKIFSLCQLDNNINVFNLPYLIFSPYETIFIKNTHSYQIKYIPKPDIFLFKKIDYRIFYIFEEISFRMLYFLSICRNQKDKIILIKKHREKLDDKKDILGFEVKCAYNPYKLIQDEMKKGNFYAIIFRSESTIGPIIPRWFRMKYEWIEFIFQYLNYLNLSPVILIEPKKNQEYNNLPVFIKQYEDIFYQPKKILPSEISNIYFEIEKIRLLE